MPDGDIRTAYFRWLDDTYGWWGSKEIQTRYAFTSAGVNPYYQHFVNKVYGKPEAAKNVPVPPLAAKTAPSAAPATGSKQPVQSMGFTSLPETVDLGGGLIVPVQWETLSYFDYKNCLF